VHILLDGGLKAPEEYMHQETIIKGDEKEPIIALASIAAKVLRDQMMEELAEVHPEYGFENHKGYGTNEHYKAIKKHGLTAYHRRSFLSNFLNTAQA
jgi:ribonuclease HII